MQLIDVIAKMFLDDMVAEHMGRRNREHLRMFVETFPNGFVRIVLSSLPYSISDSRDKP